MQNSESFCADDFLHGDAHRRKCSEYNSKYTIVLTGMPHAWRLLGTPPAMAGPTAAWGRAAGRQVAVAVYQDISEEVKFMKVAGLAPPNAPHNWHCQWALCQPCVLGLDFAMWLANDQVEVRSCRPVWGNAQLGHGRWAALPLGARQQWQNKTGLLCQRLVEVTPCIALQQDGLQPSLGCTPGAWGFQLFPRWSPRPSGGATQRLAPAVCPRFFMQTRPQCAMHQAAATPPWGFVWRCACTGRCGAPCQLGLKFCR